MSALLRLDQAHRLFYGADELSAVYRDGERLWPFGPDLLYAGGGAGFVIVPEIGGVFTDTAGTTPASVPSSLARVNDISGNGIDVTQATAAQRPVLGRAPVSRRNAIANSHVADAVLLGTVAAAASALDNGRTIPMERYTSTSTPATLVTTGLHKTYPMLAGIEWTISAYIRPLANRYIYFGSNGAGGQSNVGGIIRIDTTNDSIALVRTFANTFPGAYKIQNLGGGLYRATINGRYTSQTNSKTISVWCSDQLVTTNTTATFNVFTQAPNGPFDAGGWQYEEGAPPELNPDPTPWQHVGAATSDVTEEDTPDFPLIRFDNVDDRLIGTLPGAVSGDLVIAGKNGSLIESVSLASGSAILVGSGCPPVAARALIAVGDLVGAAVFNKTLSLDERDRLMRYFGKRGAKGLYQLGPELLTNPSFDVAGGAGWTTSGLADFSTPGQVRIADVAATDGAISQQVMGVAAGDLICVEYEIVSENSTISNSFRVRFGASLGSAGDGDVLIGLDPVGVNKLYHQARRDNPFMQFLAFSTGTEVVLNYISAKKMTAGAIP
ncbi:MAG: hypothetical protein B7Y80_01395 [Hyphomicrobium sp. 32-62-53]|nr:MAG: hypothetical protein B7Z29_01740 [Hyphomicrobium sp. 12-62-95]OYY01409.1 MAG: hypothetical protein B7Y80_01395 [Hyphomicrobium sp. 32-62-53]